MVSLELFDQLKLDNNDLVYIAGKVTINNGHIQIAIKVTACSCWVVISINTALFSPLGPQSAQERHIMVKNCNIPSAKRSMPMVLFMNHKQITQCVKSAQYSIDNVQ